MQRSALVVTPLARTASGVQFVGSASGAPPLIADVRLRLERTMISSLSPWIEVESHDGQTIVQTRDFEVFDFLDDYFLEKLGIDYTYVHTRGTATTPAQHQLVFPPEVTSKVIEDALAVLDPLEIRRMAELNGNY